MSKTETDLQLFQPNADHVRLAHMLAKLPNVENISWSTSDAETSVCLNIDCSNIVSLSVIAEIFVDRGESFLRVIGATDTCDGVLVQVTFAADIDFQKLIAGFEDFIVVGSAADLPESVA